MCMSESLQTAPPKPWGIIATALWALGSLAVLIGMVQLLGWSSGGLVGGTILQVQLLALAARQRGWRASEYLGWIVPNPRDAAVTLAVFVALILATDALYYLLNVDAVPPVQINTYRSAREAGVGLLVILWIAAIVLAPLGEESCSAGSSTAAGHDPRVPWCLQCWSSRRCGRSSTGNTTGSGFCKYSCRAWC
jgi:hypothetical protein